jgi:hypothetical protein
MEYVTTPNEVRAAFSKGKIASMLGIEGLIGNFALANLDSIKSELLLPQFVFYTTLAHGTLPSHITAIMLSQHLALLSPMERRTVV